ncbi:helix-turn-helix domain-containing protein [Nocardia farcinica]|uniref:helix-turn-helix domain-containing protein n=1 Tax=Nocardia farcinica TaxID=37329 RepID=UPI001893A843|nr:helix-turn-helix transcriptional regulator [Nocardia farcinica]MBF6187593.1 helix-turn-helix transcriptional regulator [Nocardia farcinica]MBF6254465.1 helix-turn-helix transcriptional regulator [Nocardia farcinica]MBF6373896.1 helix-turn-helix transcriptional regulator [Nocardia farcinica]MBF6411008.1 helix-turn-helix transcriptional regulator [Nocardia farcinica]
MERLTGKSKRVAARVRAAIEESGLSERQVAEITGIARETLRRRLVGKTAFTIDELEAIAHELGKGDYTVFVDFPRSAAS